MTTNIDTALSEFLIAQGIIKKEALDPLVGKATAGNLGQLLIQKGLGRSHIPLIMDPVVCDGSVGLIESYSRKLSEVNLILTYRSHLVS